MKECECNKNKKIRPFDSCIFCAHKHAASALALTTFLIDDDILLKFRIISQLNLSKWHLNEKLKSFFKFYDNIILNILSCKEFKKELTSLVEFLWDETKNDKLLFSFNNNNEIFNDKKTILNGLICISNSLELLKYEHSYNKINYSYAIGQLNLAVWHFQNINVQYATKCRQLYKNIENDEINFKQIENLIIKIFKESNIFYKDVE